MTTPTFIHPLIFSIHFPTQVKLGDSKLLLRTQLFTLLLIKTFYVALLSQLELGTSELYPASFIASKGPALEKAEEPTSLIMSNLLFVHKQLAPHHLLCEPLQGGARRAEV